MNGIHQESFDSVNLILNADRDFYQAINDFQLTNDVNSKEYIENIEQVRERVSEANKILQQNETRWKKNNSASSTKNLFELFEEFNREFENWVTFNNKTNEYNEQSKLQFENARGYINQIGELIKTIADAEIKLLMVEKDAMLRNIFYINIAIFILVLILVLVLLKVIKTSLKTLTDASEELAIGNVDIVVECLSNDEIGRLSKSFNLMIQSTREQALVAEKIAAGDLTVDIKIKSDKDILAKSMSKVIETLRALIVETNLLTEAAAIGQLNTRGNAEQFNGGYVDIINGINKTLDAVVEPLHEASNVLGRVAVNDYTQPMTGKYQGMLKEFADQINAVQTRLLGLQDVALRLSKGDTSRLDEFKETGKCSENDKLIPAFTAMMQSIQDMIDEVKLLSEAGIEGNLKVRGDIEKFEGGYKAVIVGLNQTLDAIHEPVTEALKVLQELAKGNLVLSVDGDYQGDHALLKNAINQAVDSFNETLSEINNAAEQVAAGAGQVSDSSQALSQGSSEQASTVEEISASITEIAAQTKQNASNAGQANELATLAKEKAIQGNSQMQEMLIAMTEINESSASISKIIKVIDEIAFQTNILALNAAVEAARAGQHGKGFAVVAEEVRNLAARSANAAKETTALIEGSIKKVEIGTKIANDTAEELNQIVSGVTKTADLVGDIAVASNEQATGITQVNQGIYQVSQVTQSNTATAEEGAAASEELSSQAQFLKSMVEKFKIKSGQETFKRMLPQSNQGLAEVAVSTTKKSAKNKRVKIDLDDTEFSKY